MCGHVTHVTDGRVCDRGDVDADWRVVEGAGPLLLELPALLEAWPLAAAAGYANP